MDPDSSGAPSATIDTDLTHMRRTETSAPDLEVGVVIDGRYALVELIGEGGFGRVYAAEDRLQERDVAIKVLTLAYDDGSGQATTRFVREAEITANLVHGNTVRVFDWGLTTAGQLFLIMERLHGESLRSRLDRAAQQKRTLGDHETRKIGIQTLQSLAEAHRHDLVHRDLKPGNIHLHRLGGRADMVKVIDFGIARRSGSKMTRAGEAVGTPTHMSPEQAQGQPVDGRSDLYALGVVLYECLVGQLPYQNRESVLLTMMLHVTAPIPDLCALAPTAVHADLAAVVVRALAKDPNDRFADADAMRAALKKVRLPRGVRVRASDAFEVPTSPFAATSPFAPTPARQRATGQKPRRMPRAVSDVVGQHRIKAPTATPRKSRRRRRMFHAAETQEIPDQDRSEDT